jgi:hypothetical protein
MLYQQKTEGVGPMEFDTIKNFAIQITWLYEEFVKTSKDVV